MSLNFTLEQDLNNGASLIFKDTSVGINYPDVKAVRFIMNNYIDELNQSNVGYQYAMEQYRLYIKTSLFPSVYDNKTLNLTSYYYPFISGLSVLLNDTFTQASRYSKPNSYLPTSAQIPLIFGLSDWALSNFTSFPGRVYDLQYEIYGDTTPTTLTNVTQDKQYIVTGSGSDTAIWNGNIYRVGEVFIAQNNGSVTFIGSGNLKILIDSYQKFFCFTWNLKHRLGLLYAKNHCCGCDMIKLRNIWVELDSLDWMNFSQSLSVKFATDTIVRLEMEISVLENCNCS